MWNWSDRKSIRPLSAYVMAHPNSAFGLVAAGSHRIFLLLSRCSIANLIISPQVKIPSSRGVAMRLRCLLLSVGFLVAAVPFARSEDKAALADGNYVLSMVTPTGDSVVC